VAGRVLREVSLDEPIRYGQGDRIEQWLNQLLCLDCSISKNNVGCPHPSKCELYYVNKDTLFSYHKASEEFLRRMMALYVSSHYKNTPNDLMLISDAPNHHLFVLLGPEPASSPTLCPRSTASCKCASRARSARALWSTSSQRASAAPVT